MELLAGKDDPHPAATLTFPSGAVDLLGTSSTGAIRVGEGAGPAGRFHYARVTWGPPGDSAVVLADGTRQPLDTGGAGGVRELRMAFLPNATTDYLLLLPVAQMVRRKADGSCFLDDRVPYRILDKARTATLRGRLTDTSGHPLGGMAVVAQIPGSRCDDDQDLPVTTFTRPDGTFTFQAVKAGAKHRVVSLPFSEGKAYDPAGAPPVEAGSPDPVILTAAVATETPGTLGFQGAGPEGERRLPHGYLLVQQKLGGEEAWTTLRALPIPAWSGGIPPLRGLPPATCMVIQEEWSTERRGSMSVRGQVARRPVASGATATHEYY
jgi:hypothetical protein